MENLTIRKAMLEDLPRIRGIYNKVKLDRTKVGEPSYEAEIQKKGFLLGTDDPHRLEEELENAFELLVAEKSGNIEGYLIADHRDEQKFYDDEYKTWFDMELKDFYYKDTKGMTLATIAVDPNSFQKGVASQLLNFLETQLKKENFKYLFSIVTAAPLTNCPTIIWHTKNGFKRLAMGRPRKLFDINNYVGILLYKKL